MKKNFNTVILTSCITAVTIDVPVTQGLLINNCTTCVLSGFPNLIGSSPDPAMPLSNFIISYDSRCEDHW